MISVRVFVPQTLFQQAEAESEIYCLFTKSWARGKVSCHFYRGCTMTFQQNSLSALVPTVPMVPVGMGGSCSSLLPQHPCQQQIQSTGIQEFRKGSPAFEAAKALEFSWFCFLGLIHHMAQSQGMRAIFQCNGFTVK